MDKTNLKTQFALKEINSIWRKVLHFGEKKKIAKGKTFSTGGDNKKAIIFLDSGSVTLSSITLKGRERIHMLFESGCIIGETTYFTKVRDSSNENIFTAKEDCVLYFFSPKLIKDTDFITEHADLIYNLLEGMSSKIAYLFSLLSDKNGETSREIICKHLIRNAQKHGSLSFIPFAKKQEFAMSMGLHRSTVFRIIKELEDEGIIRITNKKEIEIIDLESLENYAYGDK